MRQLPILVVVLVVFSAVLPGIAVADNPDLSVRINGDEATGGDEFVVNLNPDISIESSTEDQIERVLVRVDGEVTQSFSPGGTSFTESFTIQLNDNSENRVKVIVRDTSGDISSVQFTVVKDRIAPFIGFDTPFESKTGSSPPQQVSVSRSNLTFSGSFQEITSVDIMKVTRRHEYSRAGDSRKAVWSEQINDPGANFSFDAFLGIGQNYLELTLIDSFGNSRSYTIGITVIDRQNPDIRLNRLPSETRGSTVTLDGIVTDNTQIDEVTYALGDGGTTSLISSKGDAANEERQSMEFEQEITLDPGENIVRVTATDVSGRSRTVRKEIVYTDSIVPEMRLTNVSLQEDSVSVDGSVEYGSFRRVSIETVATGSGETLDLNELYSGEATSQQVSIDQELTAAEDSPTEVIVRVTDAEGEQHTETVTVSEGQTINKMTQTSTTADLTPESTTTAQSVSTSTPTSTPVATTTDATAQSTDNESTPIRVPGLGAGHAVIALFVLVVLTTRRQQR